MSLEVGQELWWVPVDSRYQHQADTVTVTKVARKWATLSNGERIDKKTWEADSGQYASFARCYPSKEFYKNSVETRRLLRELARHIDRGRVSDEVMPVSVREAAKNLGLVLSPTPDTEKG